MIFETKLHPRLFFVFCGISSRLIFSRIRRIIFKLFVNCDVKEFKEMKKIILAVIISLLPVCAGAQILVGGNIGLSTYGDRVGVNISPEVGYIVNDSFTVGGYLSYRSLSSSLGITPYARWKFVSLGNRFQFFLAAQAPMNFARDYQSYSFYLRPGAILWLADNVGMVAHIGAFGYSFVKSGNAVSRGWEARLNGDSISIGFCFGFY